MNRGMNRGLKRGLVKGLTAIVLSLSTLTSQPIYARETRQRYQTIIVNRRKYHITLDNTILDEKDNRVTRQTILSKVLQTYFINKELPKYKRTAIENRKRFNKSRTSSQLEALANAYAKILKPVLKPSPSGKLGIGKNLLEGTIQAFTDLYLDPKMYVYREITSDLQRAIKDHERFIRLVDRADLTDYRKAKTMYNLLLRSEPVIIAASESFKQIKDSQLKIQERDRREFLYLLKQKDTPRIKRRRQRVCNRVRARASRAIRNYERKKQQERNKIKKKILGNISIRFYSKPPRIPLTIK